MNYLLTTSTILSQSFWRVLTIVLMTSEITVSLEESQPEIFLQPRHFNPHPYEIDVSRGERNGPVIFPTNPEDNLIEDRSNFVTLRNLPEQNVHPVDSHPYPKVAKKQKYRISGRFRENDREASKHARKALAKHGALVLSYPPEQLAKFNKAPSQQQGDDYAFSYKVVDHLRGDDFSHSQSRSAKATNGEYRVKLPDGRVQIVSYRADKNGYKADVKYTENEEVTDRHDASHQDNSVQFQRIPIRELYQEEDEKLSKYTNHIRTSNDNIVVLQSVVPKQIPGNFNGHTGILVTPSPAYLNAVENRDLQRQLYPNVEIFTTNARDYSIGSYIPSTVSPYFEKIASNQQSTIISPEITNNGNHGLSAPTTPSSFVLTDHQGLVLDNIKLVSTTSSPLLQNRVTPTTSATLALSNLLSSLASHY